MSGGTCSVPRRTRTDRPTACGSGSGRCRAACDRSLATRVGRNNLQRRFVFDQDDRAVVPCRSGCCRHSRSRTRRRSDACRRRCRSPRSRESAARSARHRRSPGRPRAPRPRRTRPRERGTPRSCRSSPRSPRRRRRRRSRSSSPGRSIPRRSPRSQRRDSGRRRLSGPRPEARPARARAKDLYATTSTHLPRSVGSPVSRSRRRRLGRARRACCGCASPRCRSAASRALGGGTLGPRPDWLLAEPLPDSTLRGARSRRRSRRAGRLVALGRELP